MSTFQSCLKRVGVGARFCFSPPQRLLILRIKVLIEDHGFCSSFVNLAAVVLGENKNLNPHWHFSDSIGCPCSKLRVPGAREARVWSRSHDMIKEPGSTQTANNARGVDLRLTRNLPPKPSDTQSHFLPLCHSTPLRN